MTSDAKIGLLLGLVFIFVIAFIINGLPNLKSPQSSRADTLTNVVNMSDGEMGIAGKAQAQADLEWKAAVAQEETVVETPEPVVEQPKAVAESPAEPMPTANNQDVRFESPLPRVDNPLSRVGSVLDRIVAGLQTQGNLTSTVNMNVPSPVTEPAATHEQPAIASTPASRPETGSSEPIARGTQQPKPTTTVSTKPAATPGTTPAPKPVLKPGYKTYVVGDGESLSSVAKKVYGVEEGNRIANVNRIYEANKDILKSVHEVVAGQKLLIPPLPKVTVNPNNPSDVLPAELFERVKALGKPAAGQTPPSSATTRWYTVQDGDNLWKIASSQLGAGARYDEIAKLNADLLKDGAVLDVGMKIRLPAK